ncbi:hypothetical protein Pan44_54000 [Caulifigura coniformis]|uniref:Uncharacterized protein n=1 Tax=Caulifigura coniformis TaxID=2527983 RepID=A0A517SMI1_9PLAN|nr:hypothetical protein [Caulifigura coniformis]QDT57332.1 hypothetical protein Pan44_54000 [Caulifigura coniformis]
MKTLARMMSFSVVLAAGSAAIAADCRGGYADTAAPPSTAPVRTAYRSAYTSVGTSSTSLTPTYRAPGANIHHIYGPEARWEFMRNRQHLRGW